MESAAPFDIAISEDGGTTVVRVSGELDLATAPQLGDVFAAQGSGDLDVDLHGVTFLDSSGISVLVQAQKLLVARGATLRLCSLTESARRVLALAGLDEFFQLVD